MIGSRNNENSNRIFLNKKLYFGEIIPSVGDFRDIRNKIGGTPDLSQHFIFSLQSIFYLIFFLGKGKLVSTYHTNLMAKNGVKRIYGNLIKILIVNLLTPLSDKMIFISRAQMYDFYKLCLFKETFKKKSIFVYNFINKKMIINQKKRCGPNIIFVGRYTKVKGFYDLLELAKKIPEVRFGLTGSNYSGKLPKNVKNNGVVDNKAIWDYYDKNNILILPSYTEVFPMVILEAMARGLVILVSDIPGMREIIKEGRNGYFFQTGDTQKMKEIILYLKNSPKEVERISKNNLKDIHKFTAEKQVPKYIRIYEEVLKKAENRKLKNAKTNL